MLQLAFFFLIFNQFNQFCAGKFDLITDSSLTVLKDSKENILNINFLLQVPTLEL
jgi:hypothetical protein